MSEETSRAVTLSIMRDGLREKVWLLEGRLDSAASRAKASELGLEMSDERMVSVILEESARGVSPALFEKMLANLNRFLSVEDEWELYALMHKKE